MKKIALLTLVSILNGCTTKSTNLQPNDYSARQDNTIQAPQLIKIISISPTRIEVVNHDAGIFVSDNVLVEGVEISYTEKGRLFSFAQTGNVCEYKIGATILVTTYPDSTRILPNASCPMDK